jgi:rubrerythrin
MTNKEVLMVASWLVADELCHERTEYCDKSCIECAYEVQERLRQMAQEVEERPHGEWIDYNNTFYKCPDCGYLLEKCCPQCQNKVILPKEGGRQ